ncbi:homoserine kinase [Alkalimarinus sediminis]|uniref:Homoserine kinase n=1 Tax=Alkalimarinus sediminis TaxID=1632866 RepID=A0A9E8HT71_9ALTE|nr:homoserine kinase [Alkalimarinus sediminis]UZW75299.1 homoserine kinase [Alkalimarinus sediminis]
MAVYTSVTQGELTEFLAQYSLGTLLSYSEIGDGIENSNYFVTVEGQTGQDTHQQKWVLTLFENLKESQLPFFLNLMSWLASKGFSVPAPCPRHDGAINGMLKGKPAILVPCFSGRSVERPNVVHCEQLGRYVANMHQALVSYPQTRNSPRNIEWMRAIEARLFKVLTNSESALVSRSVNHYQNIKAQMESCPAGIVHGDLFRDNVLFDKGEISGVIDFFHACNDSLLFDLAVIANDWTTDSNGQYDKAKVDSLLQGYSSVRPLTNSERLLWPDFQHLAALRFWLSRLESRYLPGYQQESTQGDKTKDPDELKRMILSLGLVG